MDPELKELQQKLREWDKAHKMLSSGDKKEKEIAEKMADDALARIIASLNQDTVATKLDDFMVAPRDTLLSAPEEIKTEVSKHKRAIISAEVHASENLLQNKDVEELIKGFCTFKGDIGEFNPDSSGFCRLLEDAQKSSKKVILDNRKAPRKKKKAESRRVAKCIWSLTAGIVMIVVNTQLPPMAAISYGTGITALYQTGRDIIE